MRHYEIVFLVHPDQSEQVPAMVDRYNEMVTSGDGVVHRVEDWGRRRLAYMIDNVHKAHYVMFNIECNLTVLSDIERNFKFNDSIIRHLVIRRKTAITEESSMAKAKIKEDEAEKEKRLAEIADDEQKASTKQTETEQITEDSVEKSAGDTDEATTMQEEEK